MLVALLMAAILAPPADPPEVRGVFVEARTCDVWTGPCFANAEVNEAGREAAIGWRIDRGAVSGRDLSGLSVALVLRGEATLGDPFRDPSPVRGVLFFDERASEEQRAALERFVLAVVAPLEPEIVARRIAPIRVETGACDRGACARLAVGNAVAIATRCVKGEDCICGNEETYYPPLVSRAARSIPAVAVRHAVDAPELGLRFEERGARSAFVGEFALPARARIARRALRGGGGAASSDDRPVGCRLVEAPAAGEGALLPPDDIPRALRERLDPRALRVEDERGPLYDLWLVREAPLLAKPRREASSRFPRLPIGAFLGVLRSYGRQTDYRENPIDRGLFVLRYGLQPEDGDHMGTAPARDFLLLTGIEQDTDPAPIGDMDALVELALEASTADHPMVLFLTVPEGKKEGRARIVRHPERDEWLVDVTLPARTPGAEEPEPLRLGIVVVGVSEHY